MLTEIGRRDLAKAVEEDNNRIEIIKTNREENLRGLFFFLLLLLLLAILKSNFLDINLGETNRVVGK